VKTKASKRQLFDLILFEMKKTHYLHNTIVKWLITFESTGIQFHGFLPL